MENTRNRSNEDLNKSNVIFKYVSCIKIDGIPILPPLVSNFQLTFQIN